MDLNDPTLRELRQIKWILAGILACLAAPLLPLLLPLGIIVGAGYALFVIMRSCINHVRLTMAGWSGWMQARRRRQDHA